MEQQSCCPPKSWPSIHDDYKPKGQYIQINDMTVYHIGQGSRALVLFTDIFGIEGGRHKHVADIYSSYGYNVYLPQLLSPPFLGPRDPEKIMQTIKGQSWQVIANKFQNLIQHLQKDGITKFFGAAFCWGVLAAFRMAVIHSSFIAIASFHPSTRHQALFGEKQTDLVMNIKCPSFLYPAGNDPPNLKTHGQIIQILQNRFGKEKVGTIQFPEMVHGWVIRGDLSIENVKRDVQKAIQLSLEYFLKF